VKTPVMTQSLFAALRLSLLATLTLPLLSACGALTMKTEPALSARLVAAKPAALKVTPPTPAEQAARAVTNATEGLRLARLLRDQNRLEGAVDVYSQLDSNGLLKPLEMLEYASVAANVLTPQGTLALYGRARRALGNDPASLPVAARVNLCNGFGRARMALGQTDLALNDFGCALEADPDDVIALNGRGVLLDAQGEHAAARGLLQRAANLAPADFRITNNLALSYLADNQPAQAIRLLQQIDAPALPALKLNLAFAYYLQGQQNQARNVLTTVMAPALAERALQDFKTRGARISSGASVGAELLAASRQLLPLQEAKSNE
jgi:tetratricopeptide (TPR) repeat protein